LELIRMKKISGVPKKLEREQLLNLLAYSRALGGLELDAALIDIDAAIAICRAMKASPLGSQGLCEIALARAQRAADSSPAFWQACSDEVARLEAAVSRCEHTDWPEETTRAAALYQLRSLRSLLANQTVQVIGGIGRLL
jgi:hypothetical protein